MIVYRTNQAQFREGILSSQVEEIVHESFHRQRRKSVGASELASWKHSLRQMDTVLEDTGKPQTPRSSAGPASSKFANLLFASEATMLKSALLN
jgi:hypothetical protein